MKMTKADNKKSDIKKAEPLAPPTKEELLRELSHPDPVRDDNLRSIFDASYHHSRHQEWQRTTFVTILGALTAAIISSYDKIPNQFAPKLGVLMFGLALSIIGFLVLYTWNKPFIRHYTTSDMIVVHYWHLPRLSRLGRRLWPRHNTVLEMMREATAGNVFYFLVATFVWTFAYVIGYTVDAEPSFHKWEQQNSVVIFAHGMKVIFLVISFGFTLVMRYYFACQEWYARIKILERHTAELQKEKWNKWEQFLWNRLDSRPGQSDQ